MITFKSHACCPLKLVKHLLETDYETAYCKIIMVVPLPPTQGGVTTTIKLLWEQVDHIVLADWQRTSIIILHMNNNLIFTTNALRYVRYKSLIMNVSMVSHSFPFVLFDWFCRTVPSAPCSRESSFLPSMVCELTCMAIADSDSADYSTQGGRTPKGKATDISR